MLTHSGKLTLTRTAKLSATITLVWLVTSAGCAHKSDFRTWHDPSKHQVQFVTVEDGVRLEVLDWGGSGRPVVLLAGSGNTAHVFDDFAEKLSGPVHVYGITRRGFGASSHPNSGFDEQHLADDVLKVLDALQLIKPVLVGHSMAGGEMTTLSSQHPGRVAGLVYLDAARDPMRDYAPFRNRAAAAGVTPPSPSDSDLKSFRGYREWQMRNLGFAFPESELRNTFDTKPDGAVGTYRTASSVFAAMDVGKNKRDYAKVRVPMIAFFAVPTTPEEMVSRTYRFKDPQARAVVEENRTAIVRYINVDERSIKASAGGTRIIELPGSDHYVFLISEAEVLRELRAFLAGLR